MLEFIVLGQIPGTSLVITFSWIVAIGAIAGGATALHSVHRHHDHPLLPAVDEITL